MEEGKGERYLASGRQYGNALLGVRHQEEESLTKSSLNLCPLKSIVVARIKVLNDNKQAMVKGFNRGFRVLIS